MPARDKLYLVAASHQEISDARVNLLMNHIIPESTDTMLVTWDKHQADAMGFEFRITYGEAHYSYITKELMHDLGTYRVQKRFLNTDSDNF